MVKARVACMSYGQKRFYFVFVDILFTVYMKINQNCKITTCYYENKADILQFPSPYVSWVNIVALVSVMAQDIAIYQTSYI